MDQTHIRLWKRAESQQIADCRVFRVRHDVSLDPRNERQYDFFVIEATDWINVIPLTADGRVVLIEQYRHGIGEVTLEIPGGLVDEGESPEVAATRELAEETGFTTNDLRLLGRTRPNPAIQNNWVHSFVALNCTLSGSRMPDGSEDIAIRLVARSEIPHLIASGAIDHALVVAAFYMFDQRRSDLQIQV